MKVDAIWASHGWWGQGTCPTCPEATGRGQRRGDPWATRTSPPGTQDAGEQERVEREKSLDQTEGVRPPSRLVQVAGGVASGAEGGAVALVCLPPWHLEGIWMGPPGPLV